MTNDSIKNNSSLELADGTEQQASDNVISFKDAARLIQLKKQFAAISVELGFDFSGAAEFIAAEIKERLGKNLPQVAFEDLPETNVGKVRWRLAQMVIDSGLFKYEPIDEISENTGFRFDASSSFRFENCPVTVSIYMELEPLDFDGVEVAIYQISLRPDKGVALSDLDVQSIARQLMGLGSIPVCGCVLLRDEGYVLIIEIELTDSINERIIRRLTNIMASNEPEKKIS